MLIYIIVDAYFVQKKNGQIKVRERERESN